MKNFLHPDKEFRFNEILFENRNKNYGAYVLRNEESKTRLLSDQLLPNLSRRRKICGARSGEEIPQNAGKHY